MNSSSSTVHPSASANQATEQHLSLPPGGDAMDRQRSQESSSSRSGKRDLETSFSLGLEHSDQSRGPNKVQRLTSNLEHPKQRQRTINNRGKGSSRPMATVSAYTTTTPLSSKQKRFVQRWYEWFARGEASYLAREQVGALATLLGAPSQTVLEYITKKYINPRANQQLSSPLNADLAPHAVPNGSSLPPSEYSFAEANKHLLPQTFAMVEKYVLGCKRRRAQSDGRRCVNDGPFKCTFGCSYRTKRAFDWRRHEETHEPQELWLCDLCVQNQEQNPFLVNRKDKFLKHVKDTHKDCEPEEVLIASRVDFRANFDPRCPLCSEVTFSWDERCRHVLGHYEDEVEEKARGQRGTWTSSTSNGDGNDLDEQTDSSGSSDDDEPVEFPTYLPPSSRRDRTGGPGGGSGTMGGGQSTFRGTWSNHGRDSAGGNSSYSYPNTGPSSYSQRVHNQSESKATESRTGSEVILHPSLSMRAPSSHNQGSDSFVSPSPPRV
ncbi:hypothetical protein EJ04DRAFT_481963 [Polyplosphaeria fusca]|uniref:C2H2-type domain-containing protein n=1 Tax=Polyplosphaeria fusca TaxID=682080 RepID=A0A9P4RBX5_9PLEO|nr:hypothetical protein EJ04DRAFT_481963 [Polyplosphaeria fusca]